MADVIMLAIMAAFFALAVLVVKACEAIVGPDVEAEHLAAEPAAGEPAEEQAA